MAHALMACHVCDQVREKETAAIGCLSGAVLSGMEAKGRSKEKERQAVAPQVRTMQF